MKLIIVWVKIYQTVAIFRFTGLFQRYDRRDRVSTTQTLSF